MKNQIDKIVLSKGKDHCEVHLANGTTLHFNFYKLGMTYIEGLAWIEEEVLHATNNWTTESRPGQIDDQTVLLKAV